MIQVRGLTLIEILIVLAIIAVLGTIALPNYQEYIRRGHQSDAMIALQQLANEQEQFYFDNNRYSANFVSIGVPERSPDGYYTLTLASVSTTMYVARASPVGSTGVTGPGWFEIRSNGRKSWDPGADGVFECGWPDAGRAGKGCRFGGRAGGD